MAFVAVPPGSFVMGSPETEQHRDKDERPHRVTITKGFYMQESEVTYDQWVSVMGKRGREKGRLGDLPVVRVSWHDCIRFISRLNKLGEGIYRLPTEAEWEYAARAGTKTPFWWGEEIDCKKALYANNKNGISECSPESMARGLPETGPAPAKSYAPNPWGLYDMHGNVWEWCADWYGAYADGEAVDPMGPAQGTYRVRRGGSWFKYGYLCRSANRNFAHPASRYETVGFRLVRVID
jgi:formylglycine-generating enzyme required for sulfatase activity